MKHNISLKSKCRSNLSFMSLKGDIEDGVYVLIGRGDSRRPWSHCLNNVKYFDVYM